MSSSRPAVPVAAIAAVAAVALCVAWGVRAQEEPPAEAMSPEMAAEMAAWQEAMTPGPQHQRLAAMAGEWNLDLTMWMEPGTEPMKSVASATRRMTFDGRFLEEDVTGEFMGAPFLGRAVTGYDNASGKWWSTWMDNHTTGLMVGERDWDEETNTFTMVSTSTDPTTGGKRRVEGKLTVHSADHEVHEMWEERGGERFKSMEIVYRRK
jgi:hypothetical protein